MEARSTIVYFLLFDALWVPPHRANNYCCPRPRALEIEQYENTKNMIFAQRLDHEMKKRKKQENEQTRSRKLTLNHHQEKWCLTTFFIVDMWKKFSSLVLFSFLIDFCSEVKIIGVVNFIKVVTKTLEKELTRWSQLSSLYAAYFAR